MPTQPDYEWGVIKDFSPGIHQRLSSDYPPGTASPINTYRCYAVEGGALAPLPARYTQTITHTPPVAGDHNLAEEIRIIGLHAVNPMYNPTDTSYGIDQCNTALFLAYEYWTSASMTPGNADNIVHQQVDAYHREFLHPAWNTIWSASDNSPYSPKIRPRHTQFATCRSNHNATTQSGPIVVAWASSGYAQFYPDDTAPSSGTAVALPGDKSDGATGGLIWPDTLVAHQDRIVVFPLTLSSFGPFDTSTTNENFYYTQKNDLRTLEPTLAGNYLSFPPSNENPNGYGVVASLTYNQLLVIKCKGGAIVLQGDMAVFSAKTLPYVRGTGLAMNNGTVCPLGYVYPTDAGGVWLWQGGDVSQHLTKHLAPEFWRPEPVSSLASGRVDNQWGYDWTQSTDANNFAIFPNNWIWDTDLGGWWRLESADEDRGGVILHRAVSDWRNHFLWATPAGWVNSTDPVIYEYDLTLPTTSYSWQSQPISMTMDRTANVRDIEVVATGLGIIKVTVRTKDNPDGGQCILRSTSAIHPDITRGTISPAVTGTHISIQVEAIADDPDGSAGAPLIHEIRYATQESHHTRR